MANSTLWGISASLQHPPIVQVDDTTGVTLTHFIAPHDTPFGFANGTSIAVDFVNQLIYYGYSGRLELSNDPRIYLTNFSGTDLGIWLDTSTIIHPFPASLGLASLCFDNGTLWLQDSSAAPFADINGYQIDIATKTLIRTVPGMGAFPNASNGAVHSFFYANTSVTPNIVILNQLVATHPGDPGFPFPVDNQKGDLYHLSGTTLTLVTPGFIDPLAAGATGYVDASLTFDGVHYIVSNPLSTFGGPTQQLLFFNSNGSFASQIQLPPPGPLVPAQGGNSGWLLVGIAATAPVPPPVAQNFRIGLRGVKRWPKVAK